MDIILILLIASYSVCLLLLLSVPLRRRAIRLRAGRRIYAFPPRKSSFFRAMGIVFLCAAIVFAVRSGFFSIFVDIAFCGTAILGVEFAARLLSLAGLCGAWQNALIVDGDMVLYDDITLFPVLQLPPEEQKDYSPNVLVAETKSRGSVSLIFPSAQDCRKALEVIFTERPELKP